MPHALKISIVDEISPDLLLRDLATSFMNTIESQECKAVMIDFLGVESITRTFAHEYVCRRDRSPLDIQEVNVPSFVSRMFSIVHDSEKGPRFEELRNANVIDL